MEIRWPSFPIARHTKHTFEKLFQRMANRIAVGELRYGPAKPGHQWMKRARMELSAYRKTGNAEHLINAANYCGLECAAPEHPKHHFDGTVDSATRGKRGIKDVR